MGENDDVKKGPVKHFSDLQVWKLARDLKIQLYQLVEKLPEIEKYNLKQQIIRCAVSVTANIAEGYGRYHFKENIQFCRQARGSLYELQDHLITCMDFNYISSDSYPELTRLITDAIRT